MPVIKLECSQDKGEVYTLDLDAARCSFTLKSMIEELEMEEDDDDNVLACPNVHSDTLGKIVEWANHHKTDPIGDRGVREIVVTSWDNDFIQSLDQSTVFEMANGSVFLEIKGLMDLCAKVIADMIRGKTPEEIRKMFNIKNDLTDQEQERIRMENEWCQEHVDD